jgi:hypothetical protein
MRAEFWLENVKEEIIRKITPRWDDNIKMDLREIGWGYGLDLSGSGQGPVAGYCEHGNELSVSIKAGEFLD